MRERSGTTDGGERLRILFLTARFPWPPLRGDQVRAYHQIRLLSRRHDITLIAATARRPTPEAWARMTACCRRVIVAPFTAASALRGLGKLVAGDARPVQALLYAGAGRAQVATALAGGEYDVVHAQLLRTVGWLPRQGCPPLVVDLVDALSASYVRRRAVEAWWKRRALGWEAARLAGYERRLVREAARCIVVSQAERAALGAQAPAVDVNANGIDLEAFPFAFRPVAPARVVFVGNLGYPPNADGIAWFAREALPRLRARRGAVELVIVGPRAPRRVRRLAELPGVVLTGLVPDVHAVLAGAGVAVAPLRAGGGIQNKVLEAMAAGTPVVATSRAVAGVAAVPGEHCLVADDAEGLADATSRLLSDRGLRAQVATAARALVAESYSWERSVSELERVYRSAHSVHSARSARPAPAAGTAGTERDGSPAMGAGG